MRFGMTKTLLFCVLCFPAFAFSQEKPGAVPPDPLYIIQANDMLEVFVYKEPDLTRKVLVRPDGRISFPLVQDLQAAGSNPGELKERIETRLQEYLSAPSVTVIVDTIKSYQVFVVGKVQKPGPIVIEKPITVLQALAFAGGFQEYAKDSEITVVRTNGANSTVLPFNYREVIKGRNSEQNIYLKSGDVVVVP
jgi:polysaccharide biosynthesis/export protein